MPKPSPCVLCGHFIALPADMDEAIVTSHGLWAARSVVISYATASPNADQGVDIGTEIPSCNNHTRSSAVLHAAITPPDWHTRHTHANWTAYHRNLAWASDPQSVQPPSAFAAHEACWAMLSWKVASRSKEGPHKQQLHTFPPPSPSSCGVLDTLAHTHPHHPPPRPLALASHAQPTSHAGSTTWLHCFVERWCRGWWQPLHYHMVCAREGWRRHNHALVSQRVWALAHEHGLGVLCSALTKPLKALTDSGQLEAEFWQHPMTPSCSSGGGGATNTPASDPPPSPTTKNLLALMGTLPRQWLDAHKPARAPPCPPSAFPLVLRDCCTVLGNAVAPHDTHGVHGPLHRATSLPLPPRGDQPTHPPMQRSSSSSARLMRGALRGVPMQTQRRLQSACAGMSTLEQLPVELLQRVVQALPDVQSVVALRGASSTLRTVLGGCLGDGDRADDCDHVFWRALFRDHFAALMPTLVGREDTVDFCTTYLACGAALGSGRWRVYEGLRLWAVIEAVVEAVVEVG